MLSCHHRSASGSLDEGWDIRRGHIDATVRQGATLIHLWIAICSPLRPIFGAAPISRLDEESWVILPLRYERTWPKGVELLSANSCPIGDLLDPGMQLRLCNSPGATSLEIEAL